MTDWKRKLAAYLHDPPSKCLDIRTHGERSDAAFRQAGFTDTEVGEYFAHADHTAAAADRFPFPKSQAAGLQCVFDGVRNAFRHPLSGEPLPYHSEFKSVEQGFDGEQSVQPALSPEPLARLPNDDARWRARFFAHWRLWPQHAMEKDYRMALLPADTRIPDHSIWTHMQVVSALAGCVNADKHWQPAFLKFQLGPVQDFIAAARSTRDLWSGSYLLSWLMAAGLKALSSEVGPDAVIFPNLRNQPLFDLRWRKDIWAEVCIGDDTVWDSMRERANRNRRENVASNPDLDLLTPNLPNVFLAVVPSDRAAELADVVVEAIREEWRAICESVWSKVEPSGLLEFLPPKLSADAAKKRFNAHCDRFLSLTWHALAWPKTPAEARELAVLLPEEKPQEDEMTLLQRFDTVVVAATQAMPKDHRDPRFFVDGERGPKDTLNNVGIGWALIAAVSGWSLDAVRQTRDFAAWQSGGWQETGVAQSKDAITGREEMLFGGSGFADKVKDSKLFEPEWSRLFKHDDEIGAITLVKRVWHWSWLSEEWGLEARRGHLPMPNTRSLADHQPFGDDSEEDVDRIGDDARGGKYFAVLALDGDSIGKWISGEKTPHYKSQFASYTDGSGAHSQGAVEYFERKSDPDGHGILKDRFADLLQTRRLVSPSYHLQFSEALSNFALLCARPVVEAFKGRLIYAGGDDVVAMLPADTALSCARALRAAFQGAEVVGPDGRRLFTSPAPGFLTSEKMSDQNGYSIPFLVPGRAADCSVGIAIAHFKSPLQDVVREAQCAEKRAKSAKSELDRSAVAVTLMKRSGETIQWGCKWQSGGLDAFNAIMDGMQGKLGGTKPVEGFDQVVRDILARDISTAAARNQGKQYSHDESEKIRDRILAYLASSSLPDANRKVRALIGLCQSVAFVERNQHGNQADAANPKRETQSAAERQPVL